jgi:hypothetical protein
MISQRDSHLHSFWRIILSTAAVFTILSCAADPFYDLGWFNSFFQKDEEQNIALTEIPITQTVLAEQVDQVNATMTARAEVPLLEPPPAPAPLEPSPVPVSSPPVITKVDFLSGIPANGTKFTGWVSFKDPDGDVNWMKMEVVRSVSMKGFEADPRPHMLGTPTDGKCRFQIWCYRKQEATMRVTLIDAAGNSSNPVEFEFECY